MSVNEFLEQAHELKPVEKYLVIESLIQDLSHIDKEIEDAWIEESERRLKLYDEGKLKTVSMEEVFGKIQY
jgi:putative addiction module component (TIGR02574 family)